MTTPTPPPLLNLDDLDTSRAVQFRGEEYELASYGSLSPKAFNRVQSLGRMAREWQERTFSDAEMAKLEKEFDEVMEFLIPNMPTNVRQGLGLPHKNALLGFFFQTASNGMGEAEAAQETTPEPPSQTTAS